MQSIPDVTERNVSDTMAIDEEIIARMKCLPEPMLGEVLSFIIKLMEDTEAGLDEDWARFSLSSTLADMEDEAPLYSESDLREIF